MTCTYICMSCVKVISRNQMCQLQRSAMVSCIFVLSNTTILYCSYVYVTAKTVAFYNTIIPNCKPCESIYNFNLLMHGRYNFCSIARTSCFFCLHNLTLLTVLPLLLYYNTASYWHIIFKRKSGKTHIYIYAQILVLCQSASTVMPT